MRFHCKAAWRTRSRWKLVQDRLENMNSFIEAVPSFRWTIYFFFLSSRVRSFVSVDKFFGEKMVNLAVSRENEQASVSYFRAVNEVISGRLRPDLTTEDKSVVFSNESIRERLPWNRRRFSWKRQSHFSRTSTENRIYRDARNESVQEWIFFGTVGGPVNRVCFVEIIIASWSIFHFEQKRTDRPREENKKIEGKRKVMELYKDELSPLNLSVRSGNIFHLASPFRPRTRSSLLWQDNRTTPRSDIYVTKVETERRRCLHGRHVCLSFVVDSPLAHWQWVTALFIPCYTDKRYDPLAIWYFIWCQIRTTNVEIWNSTPLLFFNLFLHFSSIV